MPNHIFHGEGTTASRKAVLDLLKIDKDKGCAIYEIEGDKITPQELEVALSTTSLFGQDSIFIENLLSRPKSKDKDVCIDLVARYDGPKNIYIWEKKELTVATLKKFAHFKISNSKVPTLLFTLLESLVPGNLPKASQLLHQVVSDIEDIIIFTMVARQIGYLIMVKSGTNPKFAPWQIGKLKSQASKWSDIQLETFIARLTQIDYQIKTGKSKLSYLDHLDLLLASLLR